MTSEILAGAERKMLRAVEAMERDFQALRTGRASTSLVERLTVDYYGTQTPLNQLASITVPESHQIVIQPWDRGVIGAIEKAIQKSDIGLTPNVDGTLVRLNIPPLSGDVRKKMVARTKDLSEEAKIAIRNVRRDANKHADAGEKDGEMSEDDCKGLKDEVQELTKKYETQANDLAAAKEAEVMGG